MSPPLKRRPLLDELTSIGIRLTSQRRALVAVIQEASAHLDASSLLELARQREPGIDRATVYRTLELLKKLRLIIELDFMHLEGERHYYKVRTEKDHIHLACFVCGRIQEFTSPMLESLKEEIARQTGFEIRVTRLELGGICHVCASTGAKNSSAREEDLTQAAGN